MLWGREIIQTAYLSFINECSKLPQSGISKFMLLNETTLRRNLAPLVTAPGVVEDIHSALRRVHNDVEEVLHVVGSPWK